MSAPGGCLLQGVCSQGVSAPGGCAPGGGSGGDPPTDTAAGGTHPTGMHSCSFFPLQRVFMVDRIK